MAARRRGARHGARRSVRQWHDRASDGGAAFPSFGDFEGPWTTDDNFLQCSLLCHLIEAAAQLFQGHIESFKVQPLHQPSPI